ncbi:MAG: F0F1 ATP synthase subunit A, partial [Candidatus Azobacteroides sp.]|nr:F0F1 ATP synthase subunit A [Candidatus Azobacteroides sp.]
MGKSRNYIMLGIVFFFSLNSLFASETENTKKLDIKAIIFEHVEDAYSWHIFTVGEHRVSMPLPVIVKSATRGWFVFSSAKLSDDRIYEGFYLSPETGKVVEQQADKSVVRPFDLSLTKNVCSIFLSCALILTIFLVLAHSYRNDPMRGRKGFLGSIEMLFLFVYEDVIIPIIGKDYHKFAPYLLTVFFFIFINNLLGLIPIFPGGANVTGNIAITMVLAVITFL